MHNHRTRETILKQQLIKQSLSKSERLAEKLTSGSRKILISDPNKNQTTISNIRDNSEPKTTETTISNEAQSLHNILQNIAEQLEDLKKSEAEDPSLKQSFLIDSILNPKEGPGLIEKPDISITPETGWWRGPVPTLYPQETPSTKQTQVVDLLEQKLYQSILENGNEPLSANELLKQVASIYGDSTYEMETRPQSANPYIRTGAYHGITKYSGLTGMMQDAIQKSTGHNSLFAPLNTDTLRNLLYQARDFKSILTPSLQQVTPYGQTNKLATLVSSIEKQENVVGFLETKLQEAILGAPSDNVFDQPTLDNLITNIGAIYGNSLTGLTESMKKGFTDFQQYDATGKALPLGQEGLRTMLIQSRALLEEQKISYQAEVKQQAPYPVFMGGMVQTIQSVIQQLSSLLGNLCSYYNQPILQPICQPIRPIFKPTPPQIPSLPPIDQPIRLPVINKVPIEPEYFVQHNQDQLLQKEFIKSQIEDLVAQGALDPDHPEFANLQSLMVSYSSVRSS